jgi:hypothetical protein
LRQNTKQIGYLRSKKLLTPNDRKHCVDNITVLRVLLISAKIIITRFLGNKMVLHVDQQYSELATPNARMPENTKVCKADIWPIEFEERSNHPQIQLTPSTHSKKAYFKWNFPNANGLSQVYKIVF